MYLRCSVEDCATVLHLHDRALACPKCGELLEVVVSAPQMKPAGLKQLWRERRMSNEPLDVSGVWRFREFIPHAYGSTRVVTMGEGNTRLVAGRRTAQWADVTRLWFKHLGWNPTGCFKDLGMTVGITEAKYQGATTVACASTGNTAASMAAYAARAGIAAKVFLPKGYVSLPKVAQALDHGAEIVEIEGSFDTALQQLIDNAGPELYFLNSINPFRIEGQKTVMFELMEQMEWNPPDYVFCPGGNLGNSAAFGKALWELKQAGLIEKVPKMVVVQAEGANPFARLWESGDDELHPIEEPQTAATAIRIGAPRSWKKALRGVRFSGGMVLDVTDDEIAEAKAMIGNDGIGCEPASATTLAGLRKLRSEGKINRDASVVAILTGHVLKDTDYVIKMHRHASAKVEVEAV